MATRNTAWVITASAPLLRPGMSVSITVSEKYVVEEALKLLSKVREINVAAQQTVALGASPNSEPKK